MSKKQAVEPLPEALLQLLQQCGEHQRGVVLHLMMRYGVTRAADLLPEQVAGFTMELEAILEGSKPHPAASVLDDACEQPNGD